MPQLHVEIRLKEVDTGVYITRAVIEDSVHEFLTHNYLHPVYDGKELLLSESFEYRAHIDSVHVTGVDAKSKCNECFLFSDVQLKVHAYTLTPTITLNTSRDPQAKIVNLPHESLVGIWESLKYDESQIDPEQILNSLVRTGRPHNLLFQLSPNVDRYRVMLLHQADSLPLAMNVNRLVLLHGPPGCGKSTLCRVLAQKLVIRLSRTFRGGKLFEINTQDLLSKFYSESGKLVLEMFEKVLKMAHDDKELVCVLIDEIESVAASRQAFTKNGECADTVRVTNQLLTALDRIRSKPNIIVFCTSNLIESIDTAFLDRVYDAVSVPPPCASAVYTILSNILNALIDAGVVTYEPWAQTLPGGEGLSSVELADHLGKTCLPNYERLLFWEATYPDSPGPLLQTIVKECAGFSGRMLMKLPFLAITKYTWQEKCTIFDAIKALHVAVELAKAMKR